MTNSRDTIVRRPISSDVQRGFFFCVLLSAMVCCPSGAACRNSPEKSQRVQIQCKPCTDNTVSFFDKFGLSKHIPSVIYHRTYLFLQISKMYSPHFELLFIATQNESLIPLCQTHTHDSQIYNDSNHEAFRCTNAHRHTHTQSYKLRQRPDSADGQPLLCSG